MDLVIPYYGDVVMPLPFYLAQEEWLATRYPDRDFFFIWQVEPTVIVGRNQLLESEVNVDFCRDNGISLCRRKSGGGAVLADMNNIMFSYITSSTCVTTTFSAYTSMVARSLRMLGLDASDNSRNDILIGDRKVSGNSYYHKPGRSIVHGTMLYDFDERLMAGALTPPQAKLKSHGVSSIRSRVTTIREQLPDLTIEEFKHHVLNTIPDGTDPLSLTADDVREIREIEQGYYRQEWLAGKNPKGTLVNSARIDGVGTLNVYMEVARGLIKSMTLTGDFLETADASAELSRSLSGIQYNRRDILSALDRAGTSSLIPGLSPATLVDLII